MKKILVFLHDFYEGGVSAVAKSIYDNLDSSKFKMDFVVSDDSADNEFTRSIRKNGDKIYTFSVPELNKIPVLNYYLRRKNIIKQMCRQIKKGEYAAAHIHANAYVCLPVAAKLGIPVKIMHAHEAVSDFNGNEKKSRITALIWNYRQKIYNSLPTIKAGDSTKACIAKFGEQILTDHKMRVFYPSIDRKRFDVSIYDKEEVYRKYGIDRECFNIIHVGRLSEVKNQKFIIDVVKIINEIRKASLYIIGEGSLKDDLIRYADDMGVSDRVSFLPGDTSPDIYTAMDASMFPSFSEAFGMVAVESQLMGVPCFASTNVPRDVDIGMCEFYELADGAEVWADRIINYDYSNAKINPCAEDKFDSKNTVKELEEIYAGLKH